MEIQISSAFKAKIFGEYSVIHCVVSFFFLWNDVYFLYNIGIQLTFLCSAFVLFVVALP